MELRLTRVGPVPAQGSEAKLAAVEQQLGATSQALKEAREAAVAKEHGAPYALWRPVSRAPHSQTGDRRATHALLPAFF